MTKLSLIAVILVWHCVVNGQLIFKNFDPYNPYNVVPYYTSTFVNQPTQQNWEGTATQLDESDELRNIPNMKNLIFRGGLSSRIRQLEATTASLTRQLQDTNSKLEKTIADLAAKASQADLDKTNKAVSDLNTALQTTNADLATKASKADLDNTNKAVSDLNTDLQKTNTDLATKASQADLDATNKAVTDLNTALQKTNTDLATKASQADLDKTNKAVTDLNTALQKTNTDLATKASQADLTATTADVSNLKIITSPKSIGTIPSSCGDLKTIGFVKSGIYSVMVDKKVKNVYCDFTKSNDADLQKFIGIVDVKSAPINFYGLTTTGYSTLNTAVPFDLIKLNVGNALSSTGEFTAPTRGIYYFACSGVSSYLMDVNVQLQVKTATVDWTKVGSAYALYFGTFTLHSTLELLKGDQVRLSLTRGEIFDPELYSNFVGWLIEENELVV